MKSPPPASIVDDCDDIFGPPRTYATGFCPPKNRPTMISAKYRQKEERRKVLKISVNKLRRIEDPEASLCRSVLINNTMKRLQQEARDEKVQKQQLNYPRCYENDNFLNLKSEFMKNELKASCDNVAFDDEVVRDFGANDDKLMDPFKEEFDRDFDAKMAEEVDTALSKVEEDLSNFNSETTAFTTSATNTDSTPTTNTITTSDRFQSRKRSLDDMEDCDGQDVLSKLYMPPTPRMLTNIDEDDEASMCRSVLINNTIKRLNHKARDEKIQKQQLNYPRCYENDNFLNLKSEFMKNEHKASCDNVAFDDEVERNFGANADKLMDTFKEEFDKDFDTKMAEEVDTALSRVEEDLSHFNSGTTITNSTPTIANSDRFQSRKRSLDEMEDCDVQDVLSQLYMPPTPRMLTNIDEDDEDVNVVDDEPVPKRPKLDFTELIEDTAVRSVVDEPFASTPSFPSEDSSTLLDGIVLDIDTAVRSSVRHPVASAPAKCTVDDLVHVSDSTFMHNNLPTTASESVPACGGSGSSSSIDSFGTATTTNSRLRYHQNLDAMDTSSSSSNSSSSAYSCGQASMFSELSSNVFLNLVTSLET